jgi:hypothetical protein
LEYKVKNKIKSILQNLPNTACTEPLDRLRAGCWGLPSAHALGLGDAHLKLARPICGTLRVKHFLVVD